MPLDPSIILGGRAPQLDDPMTVRAKQATLADLMGRQQMQQMQMQETQRGQQEAQTLADLYRTAGNDPQALVQGMAQRGLGARIPGFQKQQAELGEATTKNQAAQLKLASDRLKLIGARLSSRLANPNVTQDDVIGDISGLVQEGIIDQEHGARLARGLPGDPGRLRQALLAEGMRVMDESKRIELLLPKTEVRNMGGSDQQFITDQLTGQITPGQSFAKTATQDSLLTDKRTREEGALNRGVQLRGQNLTDARSREANASAAATGKAPPGYRFTPEGNLEAIPGGPADRKNTDAGIREQRSKDAAVAQADRVISKVDEALSNVGVLTTGPGSVLAGIPGTPARNLQSTLETIKANLGFAELQAMRDASPTGGALGAIAVQELNALQSTVSSLDQGQSPAQLEKSLGKVSKHYNAWKKAVGGGASAAPSAPAKTVKRTGTSGGRKVVEYSDGSIEYAD
jgi:hypothetical protein